MHYIERYIAIDSCMRRKLRGRLLMKPFILALLLACVALTYLPRHQHPPAVLSLYKLTMNFEIWQQFTLVSLVCRMALVKYLPRSLLHSKLLEVHYTNNSSCSLYNINLALHGVIRCIMLVTIIYYTDH